MLNTERNEVQINLAGETRTMRASFSAIKAIEGALGKSLVKVIDDLSIRRDMSVTDGVAVVYFGLRGFGDSRMTLDQVGDAMIAEGFLSKAEVVANFLGIALKGVPSAGKPEAADS